MVPKIRIDGNYHMQGRILVIPLNGHGKCWFEPSKISNIHKIANALIHLCSCPFVTKCLCDFAM